MKNRLFVISSIGFLLLAPVVYQEAYGVPSSQNLTIQGAPKAIPNPGLALKIKGDLMALGKTQGWDLSQVKVEADQNNNVTLSGDVVIQKFDPTQLTIDFIKAKTPDAKVTNSINFNTQQLKIGK